MTTSPITGNQYFENHDVVGATTKTMTALDDVKMLLKQNKMQLALLPHDMELPSNAVPVLQDDHQHPVFVVQPIKEDRSSTHPYVPPSSSKNEHPGNIVHHHAPPPQDDVQQRRRHDDYGVDDENNKLIGIEQEDFNDQERVIINSGDNYNSHHEEKKEEDKQYSSSTTRSSKQRYLIVPYSKLVSSFHSSHKDGRTTSSLLSGDEANNTNGSLFMYSTMVFVVLSFLTMMKQRKKKRRGGLSINVDRSYCEGSPWERAWDHVKGRLGLPTSPTVGRMETYYDSLISPPPSSSFSYKTFPTVAEMGGIDHLEAISPTGSWTNNQFDKFDV